MVSMLASSAVDRAGLTTHSKNRVTLTSLSLDLRAK
jgi:hypothetical protein